MAYIKHDWNKYTWEKGQENFQKQLNEMEDGIAEGSGKPGVYKYKGTVQFYEELPTEGQEVGDVWNVINPHEQYPAGTNFAWTGTEWDALGGSIDLSNYYTKSETNERIEIHHDEQKADITALEAEKTARETADNTKIDKPTAQFSQGLNVPYYFDVEYLDNSVIVNDYTVDLLNKDRELGKYSLTINVADSKAGLMKASDAQAVRTSLPTAIIDETNRAATAETNLQNNKQDKLTAGDNITITDNVIAAVNTKYTVTLDI